MFCKRYCRDAYPHPKKPLAERFWRYVKKTKKCWLWVNRKGVPANDYGRINLGNKHLKAHRVSWEIHFGIIPEGLEICHKCDNPPCVNPDHLFIGTKSDNQKDSWNKGRHLPVDNRGEKCGMHKLTENQVLTIRKLRVSGETLKNLSVKFDVHIQTICDIVYRKKWRHI